LQVLEDTKTKLGNTVHALKQQSARLTEELKANQEKLQASNLQEQSQQKTLKAYSAQEATILRTIQAWQTADRRVEANSSALAMALHAEQKREADRLRSAAAENQQIQNVIAQEHGNYSTLLSLQRAARAQEMDRQHILTQQLQADTAALAAAQRDSRAITQQNLALTQQQGALKRGGQQLIRKFDELRKDLR